METELKTCKTCKHHQNKKSIDDVPDECFSCVYHHKNLGYYPLWEAVDDPLEVTPEEEEAWGPADMNYVPRPDMVNHPDHYKTGGIETIDYIKAKLGVEGCINYCMGNVLKYTSRWQDKNGLEDLKKAQWYLNYAINLMKE